MKIRLPFRDILPVYHHLDVPAFYSPSHFSLSSFFLILLLSPVYILLTGFFGYKIIILLGASIFSGILIELAGIRVTGKYTGYWGLAFWVLFPLAVPPGTPLWISLTCLLISSVISVIFFGGYGRQAFHPVVLAQVLIMINFITLYDSSFAKPFFDFASGFSEYASFPLTGRTALAALKMGKTIPGIELLLGPNIGFYSDAFPFLICLSGVIFLILGGVNRKTPVSFLISLIMLSLFGNMLYPDVIYAVPQTLLAGSTLFYAFFIFSDRWTSPKTNFGRITAGILAAFLTIIMRAYSIYTEAIMFAALFNYVFSPLYDEFGFYLYRKRWHPSADGEDSGND